MPVPRRPHREQDGIAHHGSKEKGLVRLGERVPCELVVVVEADLWVATRAALERAPPYLRREVSAPCGFAYHASKGAVRLMMKSAALHWAKQGSG